jgi:L-amino acid N-acyltransferase YncA
MVEIVKAGHDRVLLVVDFVLVDFVLIDSVRIEPMTAEHAGQVLAIYQAGIDEGDATFETIASGWPEFDAARLPVHRFVAIGAPGDGGLAEVLGWVAVSPVSSRPAYAGVVEHSVYVHPAARGRRVGKLLMRELIGSTEAAGIWTIQSGIFPENQASIALHQSLGFRIVGRRERLGRHHGRWRDVLLFERRSPLVS